MGLGHSGWGNGLYSWNPESLEAGYGPGDLNALVSHGAENDRENKKKHNKTKLRSKRNGNKNGM